MTNSKLLKLTVMTMVAAAAFTTQVASAEGVLCDDWSYNDPSCSAYIKSSGNIAEGNVKQTTAGVFCEDWSFNDPSCPAFPSTTAAGGMQPSGEVMKSGTEGSQCADWSFNDKSCSAFIIR